MSNGIIYNKRNKQKKGPPSFPVTSLEDLKIIKLFRDIPNFTLKQLQGKVRRASALANEDILEFESDTESFAHFFFIAKGQVKIIGFDENARKIPINFLRKGEFFVDKPMTWNNLTASKVAAITDAEILIIRKEDLKSFARSSQVFENRIKQISDRIDYRNRIYCEDSYSRSVLDFLVDTALTQASRIKITQMNKCIECDTCYEACEDRHGFQRIERGYAKFGVMDIAQSCLTCFYPTCIPSCPVESVIFNPDSGEVEIKDDCIGCQSCAKACQYGAITIHKVDQKDERFSRFLNHPGQKRPPKFIADKCNHCNGYSDLACISHCPTGAIIELSANELLENPTLFSVNQSTQVNSQELDERSGLVKFLQKIYFLTAFVVITWLCFEFLALQEQFYAQFSLLLKAQRLGFIDPNIPLNFNKGSQLCLFIGNVGFSLIVMAMIYPLRKAFPRLLGRFGSKPLWLDFHNFAGFMGTILVLFHTGFEFEMGWGTLGMVSLLFVMITGMFGRFLYQVIPRTVATTELKFRQIQEQDRELAYKLDAIFEKGTRSRRTIDKIMEETKFEELEDPSIFQLFKSGIRSYWLLMRIKHFTPKEMESYKRQYSTFRSMVHRKVLLTRNVRFLEFASRLFVKWQYVHKPLAYVMGIFAIIHVIYNLFFFTGWT
ncbi:MAG TPA: 4Fe-4S dicluster domain-containing protein [Oligoflexia bacterium]|nr:4Fe-4S dicluster domain-containing protein [Oligoflexia bacterium]HMR24395.1 4Fe-4S dicluster domain-containing protein [Oligoflexia bacterium]